MGYFITIEGGDGCGKTSVLKEVIERLNKDGYTNIVASREPGGVKISNEIREVLLNKDNTKMDPITEALLFAASRRQHLVEKVIPALESNAVFICDRFIDSSYVYQGIAGNVGLDKVITVNELAIDGYIPDLTIFFDVEPKVALARINQEREINRLDLAGLEYHNRVYNGYKKIAKMYPERIVSVDASQSFEKVCDDVYQLIKNKLEELGYARVSD